VINIWHTKKQKQNVNQLQVSIQGWSKVQAGWAAAQGANLQGALR
jgi:hypothetical protein